MWRELSWRQRVGACRTTFGATAAIGVSFAVLLVAAAVVAAVA
jgi:hypothetical protein